MTKWNDTTERMMLIKFLEQNIDLRFDIGEAIDKWPAELGDVPTQRGIKDRFQKLKRQIRDSKVNPTLGQDAPTNQIMPATPRTVPATPGRMSAPKSKSNATTDVATRSPNPISLAQGSSTTAFKAKLLGTKTAKSVHGKRKREGGNESDEETMSDNDTDSNNEVDDHVSPVKNSETAKGGKRRPLRRSKTPVTYKLANSDDEGDDEKLVQVDDGVKERLEQSGSEEDGTFDPNVHHEENAKKLKRNWTDRIAEMDGEDEMLDQD